MSSPATTRDVIIADNDYIIRGILRSILERQNFNVLQAVDGLGAIDYARRTAACLIILDYKMPKLDGFAACAEIRGLPGYGDVPILILTAFDNDVVRAAAQHSGATAFLAKPFRPIDLLHAITTLLDPARADGGSATVAGGTPAFVWGRRVDPSPLYGEPTELSEGRRILNIYR